MFTLFKCPSFLSILVPFLINRILSDAIIFAPKDERCVTQNLVVAALKLTVSRKLRELNICYSIDFDNMNSLEKQAVAERSSHSIACVARKGCQKSG